MESYDKQRLEQLLGATGAHLAFEDQEVSILIVGGAALALRGWVARTTHDVGVLAFTHLGADPRPGS